MELESAGMRLMGLIFHSVEILAPGPVLAYTPRVLTIKKLTKTLGGRTLLREAEMSINWGERVALVGPNGAGKSTLFRMILDEDSPDEGTIERDEYAITGYLASPWASLRK